MVGCSAHYTEAAKNLHERERSIKAARGRIIDSTGAVLADNRTVCTISVIHNQITDAEAVVKILSKELGLYKASNQQKECRRTKEKCHYDFFSYIRFIFGW